MSTLDLISPDPALGHALSEQWASLNGWTFAAFASTNEALAAWADRKPEFVLLDGDSGQQFSAAFADMLAKTSPLPLLFVIGSAEGLTGLPMPVETFPKPLRLGALLMRLPFYQRLYQANPPQEVRLGPWLFLPRARQLNSEAATVKLTDKESSLLEYLCQATQPIPREELLAAVWGYEEGIDTHTLETHLYRLRRKLMPETTVLPDPFRVDQGSYEINPDWRKT